jgi:prevent-host-death family protein
MQEINASDFKARCLAILDEVNRTGEPVTILKRGKPVAQLMPPTQPEERYPQQALLGSVEILGDIVEPVLAPEDWEAEGNPRA